MASLSQTIDRMLYADVGHAKGARRPLRPPTLASARQQRHPTVAGCLFCLTDAVALAALFAFWPQPQDGASRLTALLIPALAMTGLAAAGAYRFPRGERLLSYLSLTAMVLALSYAGASFLLHRLLDMAVAPAPPGLALAGLAMLMSLHLAWFGLMARWRAKGLLTPNIVIIGATPSARELILELISGRAAGDANIVGIFDDRRRAPKDILGIPVLGPIENLLTHRALPSIDRIVIMVPEGAAERVAALMDRLSTLPHEIVLVVDPDDARVVGRIGVLNLARLGGRRVALGRAAVKRAADIVLAGLAVLAVAPVLLIVALAVKLDSPGPILFRQKRHGFNNEEFWVLKFRSMRDEAADATAARQVSANDSRVTRVGRFIRKTSLDELPQLINVLRGEMSLVGPRPHAVGMKSNGADAASLVNSYSHRHRLKPGLTGLAAVQGSRGPVDDPESLRRRVALDLTYIERQSLWLDLRIMMMTLPLILGDRTAPR